jgi:signal transduction histidine kinase
VTARTHVSRWVVLLWLTAAVAFAAIATTVLLGAPGEWTRRIVPHLVAPPVIGLGTYLWLRCPAPVLGQLTMACGASMYIIDFQSSPVEAVRATAFGLTYLYTSFATHVALGAPGGSLRGTFPRFVVVLSYASSVGIQTIRYVVDYTPVNRSWPDSTPAAIAGSIAVAVISLAVAAILVHRWFTATRPLRRWLSVPWTAALLWALVCVVAAAGNLLHTSDRVDAIMLAVLPVVWFGAVVSVHTWRRARIRATRWRLAKIALDLEPGATGDHLPILESSLATELVDPTLRLYDAPGDGRFVDAAGREAEPVPDPGQTVTLVRRPDQTVAAIVHDESLRLEPGLFSVATAAAGVAIERVNLRASQGAQTERLRRARAQLTRAALTERQRIQRDLHDGAQQRLFATVVLLDVATRRLTQSAHDAAPAVDQARTQLADAIRNLRELTAGIYPQQLVDGGLTAGLAELRRGSPIPVELDVPPVRWSPATEFTAYFVVAEALTNAYHHSGASRITVTVAESGGFLRIDVTDDGIGTASRAAGSGLRGLTDRVASADGRLTVDSAPGRGTTVRAELPVEPR